MKSLCHFCCVVRKIILFARSHSARQNTHQTNLFDATVQASRRHDRGSIAASFSQGFAKGVAALHSAIWLCGAVLR